jgi:ribosomal subunit interface protein
MLTPMRHSDSIRVPPFLLSRSQISRMPEATAEGPSSIQLTGAHMKLSVSFKDHENHKSVEKEIEHAVRKLNVLLKNYQPELVQLHAVFSKVPRKDEHMLALNLNLPTGTLHATAQNGHLRACCKKAFSEIESQVKKHQSRLRKDYEWKRKRPRQRIPAEAFS